MILSRYERMIARRYLLPGKGEAFIFLVASISLVAVMLGVAALVIVMSVMNGFRAELFDKIVGLNGHAVVQGVGGRLPDWRDIVREAKVTPGVTSAVPMIEQPLMSSYNGRVEAVLVRGMRVQDIRGNSAIRSKIIMGDLNRVTPGSGRIAIGSRLAEALGAQVGSEISLISPQGQTTPFGTVPRIVSYTVGAIFEIGVYDYDKAYVIMPIEDAQTLLLMGDTVGMVEIQTVDADRVGQILAPLAEKLGGRAVIADWRTMNAQLFEALAVERVAMFTVLSIIILVAVFNILSSLIMLVRAKTRDIAILRTMGATRGGLMRIFMTVGTTIGALGTLAGLVLGAIFLFYRQGVVNFVQFVTGQNLWDPSIRYLTELPSKTDPVEIIVIASMALVFSFLATLYPAWKAASTDPVQVLRYE
ncbi:MULTISPECIES: lipoprotein-releasing ABC transporter permease subunit [Sphingomonas]|jgi:lipoprotein-releasing system permease protein|uniref:Lipoprotein-releasing ABC transporter permease subunit n=1 Tax=Sphingomonas zeae TaxID=1646122 RepID=A0A7Y6B3B9_9SPHN|nr:MULTISPECIES: lipoprotein-releasing ABC transporter permease subunit [Sphingomonas]MBB4048252.1 lipoprotein-releasing system permease protein [Sphingomonas zeae]MDK8186141.1 lipoprotein-releasing ABC transporter permease subunit [Sphingomonas zeae]MDK8215664.1 lipoprotein-releasing ABC transporter permease subunit [Sphingomonas sp. UMB7805-LC452B]NUU46661.1 lipoprotein-releasing ABC transporter permease subunit [Sphingomonas zeae]